MGLLRNKFAAVAIAIITSMTLVSCSADSGDYEQNDNEQDDYGDFNTDCTPGYEPCLPPAADYDCEGGSGDGPAYTGRVFVTGGDPYELDGDGNGSGCVWS